MTLEDDYKQTTRLVETNFPRSRHHSQFDTATQEEVSWSPAMILIVVQVLFFNITRYSVSSSS